MLIRPIPFPEELERGYLGRVMRINGLKDVKETVAQMTAWAGFTNKSRREHSTLELLSMVAGMEITSFVTLHTTLPLRRGITSYQPDLPHGCDSHRSMLWTTGMRMTRSGAYFCRECAHEDVDFHGQSYWRREHQIPGLLWCPKHSTPLHYLDNKSAFLLPPIAHIEDASVVDEAWAKETQRNENIQKFLDLCNALLETHSPFDVKIVRDVLRSKASEFGFRDHNRPSKDPLLSDEVIARCGRTWLAMVLPSLAGKPHGKLLNQLDGVLYQATSASSVYAYALACAVLFESADEVMNAISSPETAQQPKRRRRIIDISREELVAAYVQGQGNYAQAASILGESVQIILTRLKKLGFPNLIETETKSLRSGLNAFFMEKRSIAESASLAGIGTERMEELVRDAGGELRMALQEMQGLNGGRGSGTRRPLRFTPEEARSAQGKMDFKYSPNLKPEQRRALQMDAIEDQNVLQ